MKRWAKRVAGVIWRYATGDTKSENVVDTFVRNADHLKSCSCEGCCNPRRSGWRKNHGKTRKEIQADQDMREQEHNDIRKKTD